MFRVKALLTLAGFILGIAGGIGIMLNDQASDSIRQAIGASATSNAIGIDMSNIQGMDLETALMAVQSNRANLLDQQLRDQINQIQSRNEMISKLSTLLGRLQQLQPGKGSAALPAELRLELKNAGVTLPAAEVLKGEEWTSLMAQLKSKIDGISSSQQMDMLRLQGLSNKRNEAFDVMTNFIKKMQDSRSSIIGNMR